MWQTNRHEKKLRGRVFSKNICEGTKMRASERATKWKYNSVKDPKKSFLFVGLLYYAFIKLEEE